MGWGEVGVRIKRDSKQIDVKLRERLSERKEVYDQEVATGVGAGCVCSAVHNSTTFVALTGKVQKAVFFTHQISSFTRSNGRGAYNRHIANQRLHLVFIGTPYSLIEFH